MTEAKRLKLCINCLGANHALQNCKSKLCRICNQRHNTLLHIDSERIHNIPSISANAPQLQQVSLASQACSQTPHQVLLSTANVHIADASGKLHVCRALLDSGSQANFLTEDLCNRLSLKRSNLDSVIYGINGASTNIIHKTNLQLRSIKNSFKTNMCCLVLPKISDKIPLILFDASSLSIPDNLQLADIRFNEARSIDMLIGSSTFWDLLCVGKVKVSNSKLTMQKTQLGWVVAGPLFPLQSTISTLSYFATESQDTLEEKLSKFWALEECNTPIKRSREKQEVDHSVATTKRDTLNTSSCSDIQQCVTDNYVKTQRITWKPEADILARYVVRKVRDSMTIKFYKCVYWSDSTIPISWIKGSSNKWKMFVGNHVAEIQSLTNSDDWYYVNTKENTAERFWIQNGRHAARCSIFHDCVTCFRFKPTDISYIMGSLPEPRVGTAYPFQTTGVDYAGPILIKDKKSRGFKLLKSYIALFICFSTKAIHLEIVTDLTSECFIAALRRFIARRGKPSAIHSDNSTNFVGANAKLKELGNFLSTYKLKTNIIDTLSDEGIAWSFIPPKSPHFGGLWEAGVKSVKSHLVKVVGNANLTYEEMSTVLTQIEAIINSRHLCPLTMDPTDLSSVTPAHFHVLRTLISAPDPNVLHISENRLGLYQRIQSLSQHFWKRWSRKYIP